MFLLLLLLLLFPGHPDADGEVLREDAPRLLLVRVVDLLPPQAEEQLARVATVRRRLQEKGVEPEVEGAPLVALGHGRGRAEELDADVTANLKKKKKVGNQ